MKKEIIIKGGFLPTKMTSKIDIDKAIKEVEEMSKREFKSFDKVLSNIKHL